MSSKARTARMAVRKTSARVSVVRAQEPGKKVRLWSPDRPKRPEVDPLYEQIVRLLRQDKRSRWAQANASGLSTTTLANWEKGTVRRPMGISLQMAARMLGKQVVLK